ncbi:MAG: hypothetical protein SFY66_22515 [Oculatellaceae cyanobacterium bins.114]|nr:hypothetical protein [Oculatellaceae cyanobacterium bins.114]
MSRFDAAGSKTKVQGGCCPKGQENCAPLPHVQQQDDRYSWE